MSVIKSLWHFLLFVALMIFVGGWLASDCWHDRNAEEGKQETHFIGKEADGTEVE